jgi:hypothetical protein
MGKAERCEDNARTMQGSQVMGVKCRCVLLYQGKSNDVVPQRRLNANPTCTSTTSMHSTVLHRVGKVA